MKSYKESISSNLGFFTNETSSLEGLHNKRMLPFQKNWLKNKIMISKSHQSLAFQKINELVMKERCNREITLIDGKKLIDFFSCSYLGLDMDPRIIKAATNNIEKCGITFPAARTRIHAESFEILEKLLNKIFCQGNSILFGSLHLGHLGFLPLLGSGELPSYPMASNGTHFILDKTVHSSIQINRALMEQFGTVQMVDFRNLNVLEDSVKASTRIGKTPVLIADSIGSMGGINDVKQLLNLAEKYSGYVYLDDAHGMSIHGNNGCGYVLQHLQHQFHSRLALSTSLSKAFGVVAGVIVLPTKEDVQVMKQFCPTYVFGGPPPLPVIDAAIASAKIHLSPELCSLQRDLWENVCYFDEQFCSDSEKIVNLGCQSPVRGLRIGDEFLAIKCALYLRENGYAITTAMYPTVAEGKSILRIALSSVHSKKEIKDFCTVLKKMISDFKKCEKETLNAEIR